MVLSPDEVRKRTEPSATRLKQLERRIDEALLASAAAGNARTRISTMEFPTNAAREQIAGRYRKHGWSVAYVDGPYKEDYLEFAPAHPHQNSITALAPSCNGYAR